MNIRKLPYTFEVEPLLEALGQHPLLWDEINLRTSRADSPHRESQDIWIRCAADFRDFSIPHRSVWYHPADKLPVREICIEMMALIHGQTLGGVLITKVPPGKQIYPHVDEGWHARNYEKYAIQLASSPGQSFEFEGQSLNVEPGESFWFDNAFSHWIKNPTNEERITLIMCIRRG